MPHHPDVLDHANLCRWCEANTRGYVEKIVKVLPGLTLTAGGANTVCPGNTTPIFAEETNTDSEGKDERGTLTRREILLIPSTADQWASRQQQQVRLWATAKLQLHRLR